GAAGFGGSAGFAGVAFAAPGAAALEAFAAVLSAAAAGVALASGLSSFEQLTKANVIARTEISDRIFFIGFLSREEQRAIARCIKLIAFPRWENSIIAERKRRDRPTGSRNGGGRV